MRCIFTDYRSNKEMEDRIKRLTKRNALVGGVMVQLSGEASGVEENFVSGTEYKNVGTRLQVVFREER
uniref:Uncharacterized protein n=1 Tax=Coccidioides posadasii RMSCC 3488 TaxID=454284 RepID=A0A0J6FC36_COCPO|nr:hypothetical protein CPAG_02843 [Coccidioides posadasii RMSCC 3488]